jgi:hypothetical protein
MFIGAILLQNIIDDEAPRDEHLYLAISSDSNPIVETQRQTNTTASASRYSNMTSTEFQNVSSSVLNQADNTQGRSWKIKIA